MTKRRIRYSELGAETPKKAPRVSSPVELARALAATRAIPSEVEESARAVIPSAVEESARTPSYAELLLFTVGHERFGVPLADVEEAVDLPVIHFVPEMPETMLGVISLRGVLVPVFSPGAALGQALASRTAALIFRAGARLVGVVVDDVEDAILVGDGDLRELPANSSDDLIIGVVHHEGHLISIMRAAGLVAACREARMATSA